MLINSLQGICTTIALDCFCSQENIVCMYIVNEKEEHWFFKGLQLEISLRNNNWWPEIRIHVWRFRRLIEISHLKFASLPFVNLFGEILMKSVHKKYKTPSTFWVTQFLEFCSINIKQYAYTWDYNKAKDNETAKLHFVILFSGIYGLKCLGIGL